MSIDYNVSTRQIVCQLFLVYISWGSCFIFIKLGLMSFPPFILCGLRMTFAGFFLYLMTWLQGERTRPSREDLKQTAILALFMVLLSSGLLTAGQTLAPSGTAAILSGTTPVWMILAGWLIFHEDRPGWVQMAGLTLGTSGVVALGLSQSMNGQASWLGVLLLLGSVLSWVFGSFYTRNYGTDSALSLLRHSALIMFIGGLQSLLLGLILGERILFAAIQTQSVFALTCLIFISAIVGYSSYFWLLRHTRTAVAISYEYVNPVIGVFLGWLVAGEEVNQMVIMACAAIVGSVLLLIFKRHT